MTTSASSGIAGLSESAVLAVGVKPVLVVPYAGKFDTVGRHIVIAWDSGRETAQAVTDALPICSGTGAVTVLMINAEKSNIWRGPPPSNRTVSGNVMSRLT